MMKKILLFAALLLVSTNIMANPALFLEEKTAFCYSEASLAKYLQRARSSDLDGMNKLVFAGECDFVPDGKVLSLKNYSNKIMGSMPVVAFKQGEDTLWTFQAFVQKIELQSQL